MTTADDILSVTVRVADAAVTRAGFSVPLVLAYHVHGTDVVRTYSASTFATEAAADGFATTEPGYQALAKIFAQRPRPKTAKIGKLSAAPTQILEIVPTIADGAAAQTDTFTIVDHTGTEYDVSVTTDATPTVAEWIALAVTAVNATATTVTASNGTTKLILTADAANTVHAVIDASARLAVTETTLQSGVSTSIDSIIAADNDWYGLCLPYGAPTIIEAVADKIETLDKICIAQTSSQDVLTSVTSDIASSVESQSYNNTKVLFGGNATEMSGCALMAQLLTYEPGQASLDAKILTGVTADHLSTAGSNYAQLKGALTYETIIGQAMTVDLGLGANRFLDITEITHWVKSRLQEGFVNAKLAQPKIPYTDAGIGATMYGICRNVHQQGVNNTAIDPDETTWSIEVPKVADQDAADRANRYFPGTVYSFRAQGAVHTADISVQIAA